VIFLASNAPNPNTPRIKQTALPVGLLNRQTGVKKYSRVASVAHVCVLP
jgi:hypothetical protein